MGKRIVFFDMATVAGFAYGSALGVEAWGHFEMPKSGDEIGRFLNVAAWNVAKIIDVSKPDLIGFESPFLTPHDTIRKIRKLGGLGNVVEQAAARRDIPCREARVHDIRNHFLGEGYPRTGGRAKIAVKVKSRDMGWDVDTDDEADAIAGLSYMVSLDNPFSALATTPLFLFRKGHADAARAR